MADVTVSVHEDVIATYFTEWFPGNPVAEAIDATADLVLTDAVNRAPVSARGSKYAAPGFLKSSLRVSDEQHTDTGEIARYVGTPTNKRGGANPYPFAFISNAAGVTRNANRRHGSSIINYYGTRDATDYFLQEAIDATPFVIYGTP